MDDLVEDGIVKLKEKLMKRMSSFFVVKFFERFVSFIIIYMLSELDFDDLIKVILFGLNGNVVSGFNLVDGSGMENVKLVRIVFMFVSLLVVFEWDDVVMKLMLLLIVFLCKVIIIINNFLCFC